MELLAPRLWPGPDPAAAGIWGVSEQTEGLCLSVTSQKLGSPEEMPLGSQPPQQVGGQLERGASAVLVHLPKPDSWGN